MRWTEQQLARYREQGFLSARGLFTSEEVAALDAAARDIIERGGDDGMHRESEPGGALRQVYLVHRHHEAFRELCRHPRILEPVRQILGSEVYVWHSKLNLKRGFGGAGWLWHQDYGYWRLEGVEQRLVTVGVFLDRATSDNGCLSVIEGSHKWGVLEHRVSLDRSLPPQRYISADELRARGADGRVRPVTGDPGDVLFFDCNLVHHSGPNMSPAPRKNFMVAYNDVNNRPSRPQRPDWVVSHEFEVCR